MPKTRPVFPIVEIPDNYEVELSVAHTGEIMTCRDVIPLLRAVAERLDYPGDHENDEFTIRLRRRPNA